MGVSDGDGDYNSPFIVEGAVGKSEVAQKRPHLLVRPVEYWRHSHDARPAGIRHLDIIRGVGTGEERFRFAFRFRFRFVAYSGRGARGQERQTAGLMTVTVTSIWVNPYQIV